MTIGLVHAQTPDTTCFTKHQVERIYAHQDSLKQVIESKNQIIDNQNTIIKKQEANSAQDSVIISSLKFQLSYINSDLEYYKSKGELKWYERGAPTFMMGMLSALASGWVWSKIN